MVNKTLKTTADILLLVGGLNVGLGVFGWNVIDKLVTAVSLPLLGTIIYAAIGIAAVMKIWAMVTK